MIKQFQPGVRIAVTGGAGFIGTAFVAEARRRGAAVSVLDLITPRNLHEFGPDDRFHPGNITHQPTVLAFLTDADYVIHFAADASVPSCSANPIAAFETNVSGTVNLLECLRSIKSSARFLLASYALVYGAATEIIGFTEGSELRPASIYAATKAAAEAAVSAYGRSLSIDTRIVRFSNVYGPGQAKNVLFDLTRKALAAETTLTVIGSGTQIRDFIFVQDAVEAVFAILLNNRDQFDIVNVASGEPTRIIDLAAAITRAAGKPYLEIATTNESWAGDVEIMLCDPSKLHNLYAGPRTTLADGVMQFINWGKATGAFTTSNGTLL